MVDTVHQVRGRIQPSVLLSRSEVGKCTQKEDSEMNPGMHCLRLSGTLDLGYFTVKV